MVGTMAARQEFVNAVRGKMGRVRSAALHEVGGTQKKGATRLILPHSRRMRQLAELPSPETS